MFCACTIIVLSAVSAALGGLVYYQRNAMNAQKGGLEAMEATIGALKAQADSRIEPLKQTLESKDAAIEALEARVSASAERKALAEEKLNRLIEELPLELRRVIQAEVDKERADLVRTTATQFFSGGYYAGVANLSALILQISSLALARHEQKKLTPMEYAATVATEYFRDSVLFAYRERRLAFEGTVEVVRSANVEVPDSFLKQVEQAGPENLGLGSGLIMDPEVAALSSLRGLPLGTASINR